MSRATITIEGDDEQDRRHGGGGGHVAVLDVGEDAHGRDLGLHRPVAREQHERSVLARSLWRTTAPPRRRWPGRGWAGTMRRKIVKRLAPSDAAASSASGSSSASTGCTVRTTNGRVTNRKARKIAGRVYGEVEVERAARPVEGQQHEAGDDRRQGEGDVDEHLERPLAAEVVADEHPGDERAHHDVDQRDQRAPGSTVSRMAAAVCDVGDACPRTPTTHRSTPRRSRRRAG